MCFSWYDSHHEKYINGSENKTPRGGQIGWALSSGSAGPGSEFALANTAMYTNGTWCMQNPSWVQCPPSSYLNFTSGDTKVGESAPSWKIEIVMACLWTILRDESQTVGSSSLRSSNPTLNPTQPNSENKTIPPWLYLVYLYQKSSNSDG